MTGNSAGAVDGAGRGALDGLRIADFSRVLAGPYATMLLADLGADVVKVERPGTGDDTRAWHPPADHDGTSTYYLSVNRNKRSVVLDLTTEAGREQARALVAASDVVVENFRPGTMERLGLGHQEVRARHPELVYCSISGFGSGEGAAIPGYDLLVQAVGGLMSVTGTAEGEPVKAGVALVDVITGLHASLGILAALRHRDATGEGQLVEVNLLGSLLSALVNQASAFAVAGVVPGRLGNAHPSIAPYETFPTADRPLALAVGNDKQFAVLAEVAGDPSLALDDRFRTNADRVTHRTELREILTRLLSTGGADHWSAVLLAAGVPAGPVNGLDEAFAFARQLGLPGIVEIPAAASGGEGDRPCRQVAHPIALSGTPAQYLLPPPRLGRHTEEILAHIHRPQSHRYYRYCKEPTMSGKPLKDPLELLDIASVLSDEEREIQATVARFLADRVRPHIGEWFENAHFARELAPELGKLGVLGMHLEGYGCAGTNAVSYGLACLELEAADSGFRSFVSVQGSLSMFSIWKWGSEEQKQQWLPRLAAGEAIGCFGLTEPDFGSNPAGMRTRAVRDGGDWILNGSKMWITNGGIADVATVWAQTEDGIRGFLVPRGTPGFTTQDIKQKMSLRASITSELYFDNVRLPDSARLPLAEGLRGPLSCLNEARFGILFGAVGAARDSLQAAIEYADSRVQFDKPISAFQLTQKKLADMSVSLGGAALLALHLGRLKDEHRIRPEQISVGKLSNVREAIAIARECRSILGANGISLEYSPLRHANNLESVLTYEGTSEMHTLVVGQAITGYPAFR